jgi:hypothetical protein
MLKDTTPRASLQPPTQRRLEPLPSLRFPELGPIYTEPETLADEKCALLLEIGKIKSEVESLRAEYARIVTQDTDRQNTEVERAKRNSDIVTSQTQADFCSLSSRQAALKKEDEDLDDQKLFVSKFFGSEVSDQIRVEVGVQKLEIQLMRKELAELKAENEKVEEQLNSDEMKESKERFADNVASIAELKRTLKALQDEYQENQKYVEDNPVAKEVEKDLVELERLKSRLNRLAATKFRNKKDMDVTLLNFRAAELNAGNYKPFAPGAEEALMRAEESQSDESD